MHNYSGEPIADNGDDFNRLMLISTASYNGVLKDLDFVDVDGNILSATGDQQFTNYIKGLNATGYPGVTDLTIGTIDDITGVVTPDANATTAYTTNLIDLTAFQFEASRIHNAERKGKRLYQFSGSSFAGWAGFKTRDYFAYYYDSNGNFLRKSGRQRMYDKIRYDDDVTSIRIVTIKPLDIDDVDAQVRSPLTPEGLLLENVHFIGGTGHAFSNPPNNLVVDRSTFTETKTVLPGFSLNGEDRRMGLQNQVVQNSVFKDSWTGYLNWVGAVGISVNNNIFYGTSDPNLQRTDYTTALSLNDTRDAAAYSNYIYDGAVQLGRNAQFYNNVWRGGRLEATANGVDVYDNEMVNVVIRNVPKDADREPSLFKDNRMTYYSNWGANLIGDRNMNFKYENLDILFNDKSRLTNLIDTGDTFEDVVLGQNDNAFWENTNQVEDFGGYIKNMNIRGARQLRSVRDYAKGGVYWIYTDFLGERNYSQSSMVFKKGLPVDRTINNLYVDGWVKYDLDQFSSTDIADEPTITHNNFNITIPEGEFDWTNNGAYVLDTEDKDVNLVYNGGSIDLQITSTNTGTYGKWIRLQHFGTTNFNNFSFKAASNKTWDLTVLPASVGAITFTDCTFDNVTVTLRAGVDTIVTTSGGGGGNTDLTYNNGTIESSTGTNATIPDATNATKGLATSAQITKLEGVETNAKDDQNASEVAVSTTPTNYTAATADVEAHLTGINTALATSGFNGGTITNDLILDNGTNLTPTFNLENSSGTRLRSYALNTISYIESEAISDDAARALRVKATQFGPNSNGTTDLGTNALRWNDAYLTGNIITSGEFRIDGGLQSQLLAADGSTVDNNFLSLPSIILFNVDRTYAISNRVFRTVSGNRVFTVPNETAVNFPIGTTLELLNQSGTNNPTLTFDPAITVITSLIETVAGNKTYELFAAGEKFTMTKLDSDLWELQLITNPSYYTGWADYTDTTYTTGSPFSVIDGAAAVNLPNNAGTTVDSQKPVDVTSFYDGTVITGRNGDAIGIVIEFKVRPTGAGADPRVKVSIDIGGAVGEIFPRDFTLSKGNGVEHFYLSSFFAYTLNTFESNGGIVKVSCENENVEIYDIRYVVTREHKAR